MLIVPLPWTHNIIVIEQNSWINLIDYKFPFKMLGPWTSFDLVFFFSQLFFRNIVSCSERKSIWFACFFLYYFFLTFWQIYSKGKPSSFPVSKVFNIFAHLFERKLSIESKRNQLHIVLSILIQFYSLDNSKHESIHLIKSSTLMKEKTKLFLKIILAWWSE